MQSDPRFLNVSFAGESIGAYLADYSSNLQKCLAQIPHASLDAAAQRMLKTRKAGGRVFCAGNGGSASITEHLCCDWQKGVHVQGQRSMKVQCLTSNTSLLTAIANDFGYEKSFVFQLELAELKPEDLVVLVSSSGNSENVIQAAQLAKQKGVPVIGLTGFSGGRLKELADVSLHVPFDNYGMVEDAHQTLMHVLAQYHDLTFRRGL